jgi:hypothetical protein
VLRRDKLAMWTTAVAAAAGVVYLQHRYAAADAQSGLTLVQEYRGRSGKTVGEVIASRHRGPVAWSSGEESSCLAHVRVDARAEADDYAFTVDLGARSIHPANALGEDAIRAIEGLAP